MNATTKSFADLTASDYAELQQKLAALHAENDQLRIKSVTDYLTGLFNIEGFYGAVYQQLKVNRRNKIDANILFIDLDGLKIINDTYGHHSGSDAIKTLANVISQNIRESDIACRLGGDEFLIFVSGDGHALTNRIKERLQEINLSDLLCFDINFSVGVCQIPLSAKSQEEVDACIDKADRLMYEDKRARRSSRA
jgi:diguanylate cyclase (GGDEF)-like protein